MIIIFLQIWDTLLTKYPDMIVVWAHLGLSKVIYSLWTVRLTDLITNLADDNKKFWFLSKTPFSRSSKVFTQRSTPTSSRSWWKSEWSQLLSHFSWAELSNTFFLGRIVGYIFLGQNCKISSVLGRISFFLGRIFECLLSGQNFRIPYFPRRIFRISFFREKLSKFFFSLEDSDLSLKFQASQPARRRLLGCSLEAAAHELWPQDPQYFSVTWGN